MQGGVGAKDCESLINLFTLNHNTYPDNREIGLFQLFSLAHVVLMSYLA